jgi:hypothetical protein
MAGRGGRRKNRGFAGLAQQYNTETFIYQAFKKSLIKNTLSFFFGWEG